MHAIAVRIGACYSGTCRRQNKLNVSLPLEEQIAGCNNRPSTRQKDKLSFPCCLNTMAQGCKNGYMLIRMHLYIHQPIASTSVKVVGTGICFHRLPILKMFVFFSCCALLLLPPPLPLSAVASAVFSVVVFAPASAARPEPFATYIFPSTNFLCSPN